MRSLSIVRFSIKGKQEQITLVRLDSWNLDIYPIDRTLESGKIAMQ